MAITEFITGVERGTAQDTATRLFNQLYIKRAFLV